jgi:hypothetical protein
MSMHPSDGNTYAINKHLDAMEAYEYEMDAELHCRDCGEEHDDCECGLDFEAGRATTYDEEGQADG